MLPRCFRIPFSWLLAAALGGTIHGGAAAQSSGHGPGKSLHELALFVQNGSETNFSPHFWKREKLTFTRASLKPAPKQGIFLPQWSAEDLPFFCKIEHDWAKNRARIPLKFRLGSVDYVDWLEGKSWDKLRY